MPCSFPERSCQLDAQGIPTSAGLLSELPGVLVGRGEIPRFAREAARGSVMSCSVRLRACFDGKPAARKPI